MPRLTSLSGAQVAVLFDDPLGIVEFDEVADGVPQLRDVAVDATMDDLFLQRAIEPHGDAVGLGLGDEGVGRLDAPELDLVGEVVSRTFWKRSATVSRCSTTPPASHRNARSYWRLPARWLTSRHWQRAWRGWSFSATRRASSTPTMTFSNLMDARAERGSAGRDRPLGGRLYLAMPDVEALRQLLSLWGRWQRGEGLPTGFAPWRDVFASLREIRPWGPADRLSDETIFRWREEIEDDPGEMRRIEVELWYRDRGDIRAAALRRVAEVVAEAGGALVHHAVVEEIGYEAVLLDLPAAEIVRLAEREEVHLVICDDIMLLRPQSLADVPAPGDETGPEEAIPDDEPADLPPIAALLDGVPVQNHALLDGRLEMDDPDGLEAMSVVADRHHGTAMASLILHGDRNVANEVLSRRLYMRPVPYAPGDGLREEPRRDQLLMDVIYRAVKRIKEGDEEGGATAPEVFLVNLSLGDAGRPFGGPISPWARLLDYLADRYGILFLVSAGNLARPLRVDGFAGWIEFEDADPADREQAVLMALSEQKAFRTLLSPAEALNPITVGAMHDDAVVGPRGVVSVDPYATNELPNVSSALGLGHRNVVKPDIHLPGGREHLRFQVSGGGLVVMPESGGRSGLSAAAPDGSGQPRSYGADHGHERRHRFGDPICAYDLRCADGSRWRVDACGDGGAFPCCGGQGAAGAPGPVGKPRGISRHALRAAREGKAYGEAGQHLAPARIRVPEHGRSAVLRAEPGDAGGLRNDCGG